MVKFGDRVNFRKVPLFGENVPLSHNSRPLYAAISIYSNFAAIQQKSKN